MKFGAGIVMWWKAALKGGDEIDVNAISERRQGKKVRSQIKWYKLSTCVVRRMFLMGPINNYIYLVSRKVRSSSHPHTRTRARCLTASLGLSLSLPFRDLSFSLARARLSSLLPSFCTACSLVLFLSLSRSLALSLCGSFADKEVSLTVANVFGKYHVECR